jgi:hypothetical protein
MAIGNVQLSSGVGANLRADHPRFHPTTQNDLYNQKKAMNAKVDFVVANFDQLSSHQARISIASLSKEIDRTNRMIDNAVSPDFPAYWLKSAKVDVARAEEVLLALQKSLLPPGTDIRKI